MDSGYVQACESLLHASCQPLGDARTAAVKEVPVPPRYGCLELGEHQVWPVDTVHVAMSRPARKPYERHAVGRHHPSSIEHRSEPIRALTLHDPMDGADADIMASALFHPSIDDVERTVHVDGAYPNAEDIDAID